MYMNDDCCCGFEPKEKLGSCKSEEIKEGCPNDAPAMIPFKQFMDLACKLTKVNLQGFISLCAKLTDFDTDSNQGWLYTEENMALFEKNFAYFDIDEREHYPIGDIDIIINTYGCINELADYLYNSFVISDSNKTDELDHAKYNNWFADKFDNLYSILCDINNKFIAIITAFQPDNQIAKRVINMDKPFDPGYMPYMDHMIADMTNVNVLIFTLITDIFGFEPLKDEAKDGKKD